MKTYYDCLIAFLIENSEESQHDFIEDDLSLYNLNYYISDFYIRIRYNSNKELVFKDPELVNVSKLGTVNYSLQTYYTNDLYISFKSKHALRIAQILKGIKDESTN